MIFGKRVSYMKKVLFVATVIRFLNFERGDIKLLQDMGYEVHCATNLEGENERTEDIEMIRHHIDFARSPFNYKNIGAYKRLKKLIKEEQFDLIHCHTPVGGIMARLVARQYRKKGLKVIYTAHGFHFFYGAPFKNWLLFYPIEWICSWWTDVLITINHEDYESAKKHLHAQQTGYIPGVGLDIGKINSVKIDRNDIRRQLEIPQDAFLIISVGELNENKNHEVIIKAIKQIEKSNIYYVICGKGEKEQYLLELIKNFELENKVKLLGFRKDTIELCKASDLFAFPSKREGLSVALMEAIAAKIPVICSDIRGNRDLIQDKRYMFDPWNIEQIKICIEYIIQSDIEEIILENYEHLKNYDVNCVRKRMYEIYRNQERY